MPTRVAILITRLDLGGAQEAALETACRLDPQRFEVSLLAGPGGALDDEAQRRLGGRLLLWPGLVHALSPLQDLAFVLRLALWLRRERVQVLHTHSSKAGVLGRLAGALARVPRVIHTVHGWSFNDFQPAWARSGAILLEQALAPVTDVLAVVAQSLRDKGLCLGIGQAPDYALLRAGVDRGAWSRVPRSKQALRRLLKLELGQVVGTVANLKPQKAPLDFVRCAALVAKGRPGLHFVYVGDGPLRPEAEALTRALGLQGRVHFTGWQREPQALAAGFDVFFLPSLHEGLPCVFAQALSLGLPVVASNVDGASEIVKEGANGYLCQPQDLGAFADRLGALLDDAALRRRMGAAAKRSVGPDFGFEAMAQRSAELYGTAA